VVPTRSPACHLTRSYYPAPARYPAPAYYPALARHPASAPRPALASGSYLLSSACPLSLCLSFSFSSRLIVFVEVARVGGMIIRGSLVGEGKLVREGRVSARGRCRQGGLWVLAVKADSWSCHQGVRYQGVCQQGLCGFSKEVKGASTSPRFQIMFMAGRALTGARGFGSVGASRAGQVWIHSMPSKVRSGFAPWPAGRPGLGSLHAP